MPDTSDNDKNIVVDDLQKSYGDVQVLDGIDFRVDAGEIVGFVGPNGAGKTTTMRVLSCGTEATAGTARVAGYDVHETPDAVRRNIGYLPEDVPLYEEMLVYDYLEFVARIQGVDKSDCRDRIRQVADRTGLIPVVERTIRDLSKGFRQRVGLAQAIIHRPDVVILDEPTTGLDPNQLVEIRDVITAIGDDNTILLSTHILQEVSAVCDRIVIIDEGRIVGDGTIDQLRAPIAGSGLVVEYETDAPARIRATLEALAPVERLVEQTTDSGRTSLRLEGRPDQIRDHLFDLEDDASRRLVGIRSAEPDLEEIFREYTTGIPPGVEIEEEKPNPKTDLSNWIDPSADDPSASKRRDPSTTTVE